MANTINQITKDNGEKMNLGDIEKAAIKGVEQDTEPINFNINYNRYNYCDN